MSQDRSKKEYRWGGRVQWLPGIKPRLPSYSTVAQLSDGQYWSVCIEHIRDEFYKIDTLVEQAPKLKAMQEFTLVEGEKPIAKVIVTRKIV